MTKRVLIIGGYGNFGSYIAKKLNEDANINLIIAGRSLIKGQVFCSKLPLTNKAEAVAIDITANLKKSLAQIKPDIVLHTSGPFQSQDHFVAKACLTQGCHYIDLADARDFVSEISKLNQEAKNKNLLIVSGASSVPCLSSCLIDHYIKEFAPLIEVNFAITTAQKTNRGLATTAAILSYVGNQFKTLIKGEMKSVYGWQSLHRHNFKWLGKRFLGNCDIPDLGLFPNRYPTLKTLRFYAGLEIPFMHLGLWALSLLKRIRVVPSLKTFASPLLKASFLFDRFGSDTSAFFMKLSGKDKNGEEMKITFDLIAKSGDGPYIPCMPAILIIKKLVHDKIEVTGAMPCMGLITLEEYLGALDPLDIHWETKTSG